MNFPHGSPGGEFFEAIHLAYSARQAQNWLGYALQRRREAGMAYRIDVLGPSIIEVIHTGDVTVSEAVQARCEIAELMGQRGIRLLLADISRARVEESELHLFSFNASHYDVLPRGVRIATVASPRSLKPDLQRFAETVAVNRGIQLRVFRNREQALAWLEEHTGQPGDGANNL